MNSGILEMAFTLGNTILILCIVYLVYQLAVKPPKRLKVLEEKVYEIENMVREREKNEIQREFRERENRV